MLTKDIIDFDTDIYSDNSHLNYSGAAKVTSWIGKYLGDNYELDDFSHNTVWKKDYESYYDYKREVLKNQKLLVSSLVNLEDEDFNARMEIYDKKLFDSEQLEKLCVNAGITPVDMTKTDDTSKCAKLIIKESNTDSLVEQAVFVYDATEKFDLCEVKKKE